MRTVRVYYAHPVSLFGTEQQRRDISTLEALGFEVINPSDQEKKDGYEREGMAYFERIVAGADAVAFRAFPDGRVGAGVVTEVEWALNDGKPVIELPNPITPRALDIDTTREYLRLVGAR